MTTYNGGMLRFYLPLVLRTFSILWTAADRYVTTFGIASFFAVLFNPELAEAVTNTWSGVSRWWALLPLGLLFFYGLMKANYEKFENLRQERDDLLTAKTTNEKRLVFKDLLGEAYEEGAHRYETGDEGFNQWLTNTQNLIEAALEPVW